MSAVHFEDDETVLDSGSTPGGVEKWGATAVAYQLLAYDIMKGFVKKGMKPSAVQQRRQHFQEYDSKRFANNMNNMLKRHAEGKLVPKLNMQKIQQTVNALEKGNGGGRDTTSILNSKLDGLALFSDDESEDGGRTVARKKKSDEKPREIIVKKPKDLHMILPFIMFPWTDAKLCKRVTLIVQLPSGTWKEGCVSSKITNGQTISLTLDWTHIVLLDAAKYSKAFVNTTNTGRMYNDTHVKTVSHAGAVKTLKGDSSLNLVKSTFTVRTPFVVENEFTNAEGWPGFTVLKMGAKANPQIFAHMEMMGIRDGHVQSRITKFEDFTEDDDESMNVT